MSRQPRFLENDEPRRKGSQSARYESDAAPKASTRSAEEEQLDAEVDKILAEEEAKLFGDVEKKPEPPVDNKVSLEKTRTFTTKRTEPDPDEDRIDSIPRDDDSKGKIGGNKVALIVLALLLGFSILGASAYALVHFVFAPQNTKANDSAFVETEPPTVQQDPTLIQDPTHMTEAPTEAPTVAPEKDYAKMVDAYMKKMSDRDKMCQLFIVTPEVLTAGLDDSDSAGAVTLAGEMTKNSLQEYPVGGLIYFSDNLVDQDQTKKLISNSQSYASTPLFIAVDEEGGDVARVANKLGTKKFQPMLSYKDKGEEVAHDNAEVIASNLRALGFNMDNAPVADVLSNPKNTVIGDRAYSDDYTQAATLVSSAIKGFRDGGVITVLKHFPGHGGTDEDSHEGLAYVKSTAEELKKNELQPFKSGIDAGANMVMVGHLVVNDIDPDMPASLSSKVVPELLRKELGYNGIVITDSMQMEAITSYDYETIIKGLFAADVDIILQPDDLDKYLDAMESLLDSGDIKMEQIDAKVKKILTLKYQQGIIKANAHEEDASALTTEATQENAAEDASEAPEDTPEETPEDTPEDTPETPYLPEDDDASVAA